MGLVLSINGESRSFDDLEPVSTLAALIGALQLKGDRIAVEHNGEIVERGRWTETRVNSGDRLEIVHFVGGGSGEGPGGGKDTPASQRYWLPVAEYT